MRLSHFASLFLGLPSLAGCDRPASQPPAPSATAASTASSAPPPTPAPSSSATATPNVDDAATKTTGASRITFDDEPIGAPSSSFEGVVGDWYVAEESGARGLKVDGAKRRDGQPSANLADQAKRLYGDRYAEFLDGVKAFAFFPFAIWKEEVPTGDIRISMRFYPMAGKIDQAAGIAFAIAPDGSYFGARANALEDNILFFRVVKGRRNVIDTVRNTSTPTKTWHTFAVELRGKQLIVEIDGRKRLEKTLEAVPAGRIGLWSKADSQVLFDDFTVTSIATHGSAVGPQDK